jgi:hypothetical protein
MTKWLFSTVWAPTTATEAESFLWYRATDRLQIGAALLWKQGAFRGLGSYTLAPEKGDMPMINVGLGLQGIGTGNPGYFATAEKTLAIPEGSVNGYLGMGFRANEGHGHLLGGLKFTPGQSPWTLGVQADGHNVHPFITHSFPDFTLGAYLVNLKTPGLLVSKRW